MLRTGYVALAMGATVAVLFRIGSMDADWSLRLTGRQKWRLSFLCVIQAADIVRRGLTGPAARVLFAIFAGCLIAACVMDLWEKMVYRYVWWAGGLAAGLLLFSQERCFTGALVIRWSTLLFFAGLQHLVFRKMYGRADCDAFFVCAVALYGLGLGFCDCVYHMAVTFGVLSLVQALKRNIGRNGNLKKPVALIPYIAVAFWFWVDFMA